MAIEKTSPIHMASLLAIYFAILLGLMIAAVQIRPDIVGYLPIGGSHALSDVEISDMLAPEPLDQEAAQKIIISDADTAQQAIRISLFVIGHLTGTVLLMIPISWTYKAINVDVGYSKNFLRSLIILPICATTIVLLIQDSLSLAFGLAALVAAVRFRVDLEEVTDGIFIFAAICVGLAAGIGHLGVAVIMSIFFCFANLILWTMNFGENPLDTARQMQKQAKLVTNPSEPDTAPQ